MPRTGLVVVSNRGPLSFTLDDAGTPQPGGSQGGLAGALAAVLDRSGATWVMGVMSEADRKAAAAGLVVAEGLDLVPVDPDPHVYRLAYDVVSNSVLWFVLHDMFDRARRPRFDRRFHEAWDGYRAFNATFCDAVEQVAEPGSTVLVQDYHFLLLPGMLRARRPDLRIVHFTHTPFPDPGTFAVLPSAVASELLAGMAGADACGFHTERWRDAYVACCEEAGTAPPSSFVAPLAPDALELERRAGSATVATGVEKVRALTAGHRFVLRVDRIEPSKNILRGFLAFEELLEGHPELVGEVVHLALTYPSRQNLAQYVAYRAEAEELCARINARFATPGYTPVVLDVEDDPDCSFAALTCSDVLLVNPVRDGLNLVAKEGPLVNTVDGVLLLSREAGAFAELSGAALELNPFDITGTAQAMAKALSMEPSERASRARALRSAVNARTLGDWLADQLDAAGSRAAD